MRRVTKRWIEAKADLELCEGWKKRLRKVVGDLQEPVELKKTREKVEKELEYWTLRAESARGLMEWEEKSFGFQSTGPGAEGDCQRSEGLSGKD